MTRWTNHTKATKDHPWDRSSVEWPGQRAAAAALLLTTYLDMDRPDRELLVRARSALDDALADKPRVSRAR